MDQQLQIVTTADGSKTIFNPQVGENYHSKHGALQESKHVFVNAGLNYFLDDRDRKQVSIFEVGFGTGLNFLLTADACTEKQIKLDYLGVEAYPLSTDLITETGYADYASKEIWDAFINKYPAALTAPVEINPYCQLQIAHSQLLQLKPEPRFDVVYFDAFAAIHQPEMWNEEAIGHTVQFLKPGGVFVTYAITGNLKRMLKGMGLQVQKIPGAPGKREMLRAVR